ncbi:hypothetical protein GGS21DRAFT_545816 [Xylaria nigripes]|nr:hypothetical protein GGS21DRAFT_545816 [Xylaria nigripes]
MSQKSFLLDQREDLNPPGAARPSILVDPIWSAPAALVFGAVIYYFSSQQSELTSELVCWISLPTIFSITQLGHGTRDRAEVLPSVNGLPEPNGNKTVATLSLWIIAVGLAACSIIKAEVGVVPAFLPALTPLLAIGCKYLRSGLFPPAASHTSSIVTLLTHNILGMTLAAIFAIVNLSEWDPLMYRISAIPVAFLFVAYMLLTPQDDTHSLLRSVDFATSVRPLSLRIMPILAIVLGREIYMSGFPDINPIEAITIGLAKAFTWLFTSQLAHSSSWLAASLAGTFGLLASRDPFAQETGIRALMNVIASLVTLSQIMCFVPKASKARFTIWLVALVPILPYLTNMAAIGVARSSAVVSFEKHPVELLIKQANDHFDDFLRNQSTTYAAAHAEYLRRYGFEPPYGFEDWYKFAESHRSPIIDDFDIISEGIRPFLRLSGNEVLEIMSQVYNTPGHQLWSCVMSGLPARTQCSHPGRNNDLNNARFFDRITAQFPTRLDLKFLLNHLDEPTVIIPPLSQGRSKPKISNLGGQQVYKTLTKFCSSGQNKTRRSHAQIETYGLPFVTDRKSSMNICTHAEYGEIHGLFLEPESLGLTEGLVPVLSNGAPTIFGDILYPSTAYVEEERFRYHTENDIDWDAKQNNLYWAGSTTGGHNSETSWRNLHRQRFVSLAQNLLPPGSRSHSYLQEKRRDGNITRTTTSFFNTRQYDVAFANILQCDAKACEAQRRYFKRKPWVSGDRPFQSRLVFDLDGNGISGRYYKLLASKSAPLKQTLFREWHDDRLMPWVHYVPVSQSMEELPELVFYLTSTSSGQERAREIAEQGRKWFGRAFRDIDIKIYMYRLFLELARLQDPDRPAWE